MTNIIEKENWEEARREIEKAKLGKIVVKGKDIEFNRKALENKKVSMLVLKHKSGKDRLKERDSGLNQVLCKIAHENNITLAIDFREIEQAEAKERARILSRIIQNIKLIKKYKNNLRIINKPQDKLSLSALLRVLGADTKTASEAVL